MENKKYDHYSLKNTTKTTHISRINVNIPLYVHQSYFFTKNLKKKPDFNSAQPGPGKKNFHDEKKFLKTFPKGVDHQKISRFS